MGEAIGAYREQALAPELIHIPANTLLAALLAGEVEYSAGAAGGVRLALRDQPVRLLSTLTMLNFTLVAQTAVAGGPALRGKVVGVGSRGASADRSAQQAVRSLGLDAQSHVTIVVLGDQPILLEALRLGRVDAVMLSPPHSVQAARAGYRVLANTGDLEPIVVGGLVATLDRLAAHRERTLRVLRAEWETVRCVKSHPAEIAALMMQQFNMSAEDAAAAYADTVPRY